MQIIGFSVRFLSSFLWIQMYRLGASSTTLTYFETNHEARNSFLSPRSDSVRRSSMADDILGGSIYDPSYYSSLFEDVRNNACNHQVLPSSFCHTVFFRSMFNLLGERIGWPNTSVKFVYLSISINLSSLESRPPTFNLSDK